MPRETLKAARFGPDVDRFVVTDVGSTTTKAILFKRDADWRFWYHESPTTVEKPDENVMIGVKRAMTALEQASGERLLDDGGPVVPYLSTSSAGGGLAMVVTGLVKEITAESADRVALGAGAIVLDVLAMNDGRSPYRKIESLKSLRPDMILLAGGFDGDALSGPVFLAELLTEAGLHPKLNPAALMPLVYAGNARAADFVERAIADRFLCFKVANLRPSAEHENVEPARDAIHRLFMDHVMSQAPGYEQLKQWVSAPVLPTPAAFAGILALVSKEMDLRILALDVGGATTDVFTAHKGNVFRTVSANLGMSYSILNVAELGGLNAVRELVGSDIPETELWDHIGNKYINPTRLAATPEDMRMEWALASIAIREAVRAHFTVMHSSAHDVSPDQMDVSDLMRDPPQPPLPREMFELPEYDLIIGSGGILSHSPREAAAKVLVDALKPRDDAEVALDSTFMFPHLGALAEVNPRLAQDLFFRLGLVNVGRASEVRSLGLGKAAGYVPPPRETEAQVEEPVRRGPIRLLRELAIPGEVFARAGTRVESDTVIARSTREFLRPFFLNVADSLHVPPEEIGKYLHKKLGDEVTSYEAIASRPRRWLPPVTYHSPVEGRVERILPAGVILVREKPEHAREVTVVDVAKELEIEPKRVAPYLRCKIGDEVDREQWLAAIVKPGLLKLCKSPVRGRVSRIDSKLGTIRIEPLLEEKEVRAWLPGLVEEVSDRGCAVTASGVTIQGVWGTGGEAHGELRIADLGLQTGESRPGSVVVTHFADRNALVRMKERHVAGLITAGVNLQEVLDPNPAFTIVVLEGFGRHEIRPGIMEILRAAEGKPALLDGTTQLRVGVRRPVVILPEN